jgi:hypothetical protein
MIIVCPIFLLFSTLKVDLPLPISRKRKYLPVKKKIFTGCLITVIYYNKIHFYP